MHSAPANVCGRVDVVKQPADGGKTGVSRPKSRVAPLDASRADPRLDTRLEIADGIATLTLQGAPGNPLAQPLRAAVLAHLTDLAADASVRVILLTGAAQGGGFSTGLDLRELDGIMRARGTAATTRPDPAAGLAAPSLCTLCDQIADQAQPVIAVLQGAVLGGGLELALACHARVVAPAARIGCPDLVFGLVPGAGGTQRLPRLIGAARALDLLLTPRQHPADAPLLAGLADVLDADPLAAAQALARQVVQAALEGDAEVPPVISRLAARMLARSHGAGGGGDSPWPDRPACDSPQAYLAAIAAARTRFAPRTADLAVDLPAQRVIDCVEAALLLPPAQGLAFERAAFADCLASDTARGLVHAYFAERRATQMPELTGTPRHPPAILGVVGGGVAATGIVAAALAAGLPVIQFERSQAALAAVRDRLVALPAAPDAAALQRWQPTTDLSALARAGLVIEAVAEAPQTKAQVFAALGQVTAPGTVLATNSLLQALAPLGQAARRPADVLALHLHGPAQINPLAEIVIAPSTAPAALALAVGLAQALGKHPVRAGGGAGGIGERMQAALRDALAGLVQSGVPPAVIDRALLDYGFVHAPLVALDRVGIDLALSRGGLLARDGGRVPHAHLTLLQRLTEAGRTGRTGRGNGLGFYRWDGDLAHHDPRLTALLPAAAQHDPGLSAPEIIATCLAAMANEGARLLRADIALRPSDIDLICVQGYGFPRAQGGPMQAADRVGVFEMGLLLRRLAETDPVLFAADPGFAALARHGDSFATLNRRGRDRRKIPA